MPLAIQNHPGGERFSHSASNSSGVAGIGSPSCARDSGINAFSIRLDGQNSNNTNHLTVDSPPGPYHKSKKQQETVDLLTPEAPSRATNLFSTKVAGIGRIADRSGWSGGSSSSSSSIDGSSFDGSIDGGSKSSSIDGKNESDRNEGTGGNNHPKSTLNAAASRTTMGTETFHTASSATHACAASSNPAATVKPQALASREQQRQARAESIIILSSSSEDDSDSDDDDDENLFSHDASLKKPTTKSGNSASANHDDDAKKRAPNKTRRWSENSRAAIVTKKTPPPPGQARRETESLSSYSPSLSDGCSSHFSSPDGSSSSPFAFTLPQTVAASERNHGGQRDEDSSKAGSVCARARACLDARGSKDATAPIAGVVSLLDDTDSDGDGQNKNKKNNKSTLGDSSKVKKGSCVPARGRELGFATTGTKDNDEHLQRSSLRASLSDENFRSTTGVATAADAAVTATSVLLASNSNSNSNNTPPPLHPNVTIKRGSEAFFTSASSSSTSSSASVTSTKDWEKMEEGGNGDDDDDDDLDVSSSLRERLGKMIRGSSNNNNNNNGNANNDVRLDLQQQQQQEVIEIDLD